ncbi:MAG TPA: amino acid adenylation domain-containing protein [Pseudonocardia sp.]
MISSVPRIDQLTKILAELLEETPETVAASDNLFALGLESISLMQLVARWRKTGIEIDFAELAEVPTVAAWSRLLTARQAGAESRAKSTTTVVVEPAPTEVPADRRPGEPADSEEFDLALMQHAYWVGRTDDQRLGGVAAHLYTEFDGSGVDPRRLAEVLRLLLRRHEMLRARITDNGRQCIAANPGWRGLAVHDLRGRAPDQVERALAELRDEYSHQLLDIESGEVIGTALSLLPGGRTRFHLDVDMVAADAVSYRLLLADLATLYTDPEARLPLIGYSFRQYLGRRPAERAEAARRAAGYWQSRLAELPGAPELPLAAGHPVPGQPRVRREHLVFSAEERLALAASARANGVTLAAAVATAFAEVLGAWSAQPRFLLNVPMFDRAPAHPDVDLLVGDFTSSVLLAVDLTESRVFADRVRDTQARLHTDAAYADYSGVEVLRDASRATGRQVLAPVVFTSALNLGELFSSEVGTIFGQPVWIVSQGPQVLLDAQVTEVSGGLLVNWDVRYREFADGVVSAMFGAFAELLRRLAADPAAWVRPVGELLPATQRAVREKANDTGVMPTARLLHQEFFARAAATPDAPAVLSGVGARATSLSYRRLADQALRVGAALLARGVSTGDPVGVSLPKGPDQVVAVLGVLAAGASYVPVGVEQPPARVARINALAGYRVLLTDRADQSGGLTLTEALGHPPMPEPVLGDPERLAYLLFTSGSTGEPKGVEVPHRAAMATISDLRERFALGPADRTLAVSALDFDLSVFDIFAPLSVGGAVVLVEETERRDAHRWAELVRTNRVSVLNCVPQLLESLLRANGDGNALESLRVCLLGGDRVGVELPGRLASAARGCRFVGLGGTTETAIHSTVCEVDPDAVPADWRSVPYGTPLRGVALRVVDALGRDCPDWVAGELWIGGDGVARGYRGDPARTEDRFVPYAGRRWYRTGDLARYRPDGIVEFLGRRDDQVKIRGFRVELGEVESALLADPRVHAAVAVVTGSGSPALAAAVVLEPGTDSGTETSTDSGIVPELLRSAVGELLPPHMVPDRVLPLDAVPLTANGKVDRRRVTTLLEQAGGPAEDVVAPRDELELAIQLVWSDVLDRPDLESVGVTEDFFAAGGNSLMATTLVSALREALDTGGVSVRMLFGAPTIAGLAERIRAEEPAPERLRQVASIYCEVAAMSDEQVAAALAVPGQQ